MPIEGVDYSYARPDPVELYRAGKRFACRYLYGTTPGKAVSRAEIDALHKAGLTVVLNWELSKGEAAGGYPAGVDAARRAKTIVADLGASPTAVVYFSVDYDARDMGPPREFFRGITSQWPQARTGVYGGRRVIEAAKSEGWCPYHWQTYAWSSVDGKTVWVPGAHIQQYENEVDFFGSRVNLDRAMTADYGQWSGGTVAITDEPWWDREIPAPAVVDLGAKLRAHYGLPAVNIGIKGNTVHRRGYHRSREWVLNSAYCTNRTYSVTETVGNRSGGDSRWNCALDLTLPADKLIAACKRLDVAVRAGRLEKITEWYGNDDGDNQVDGYNNIRNVVASSDSSHLWHLHMSFDRGRANENHGDVFAVLTGQQEDDVLTPDQANQLKAINDMLLNATDPTGTGTVDGRPRVALYRELTLLGQRIDKVSAAVGQVDEAVLAQLGGKSAAEVAEALLAVMSPEQARAVGELLTQA